MHIVLNNQHLSNLRITTDANKVIDLLQLFSRYQLKLPSIIKSYHDLLLFLCAFPANEIVHELALAELKRIAAAANAIYHTSNTQLKKSLMASGIAHTALLCSYSSPIAGWLVKKFPEAVEFGFSEATKDIVRNVIQLLSPAIEYEKSTQGELALIARLKFISGLQKPVDLLKWLLQLFENSPLPELVKEELYQHLKVYVKWKLTDELFNRSFLCWPVQPIVYQQGFLKIVSSVAIVKQKLGLPVNLTEASKTILLDTMKASLAFQYRETAPVTYADLEELEFFEMGSGLQIAIVGMIKEKRLVLESYVGYMVFKNGVPVSYGGGWMWGQRCKIGINIYPSFRRGESSWLFCQVLRLYYQHFGVRHFVVKPYQFGKGNTEGIRSGAFWFYYKLGFRPVDENISNDAAIERAKIQRNKNYRTPPAILHHFTACNMELILSKKSFPSFDAGKISGAVSIMINHDFNRNRKAAITACLRNMYVTLPVVPLKKKTLCQQQVIDNWSLLIALIDDIEKWRIAEKRALVHLFQLKQSGKEYDYIIQLQKHDRLWKSLHRAITKETVPGAAFIT